jgi:DNA ligase-associated metallophosphoesterase
VNGTATIELCGQRLILLPERAVYWPERRTLAVADVHVGKGTAFRAAGIPVPGGTTAGDLELLDACLDRVRARRLIVLGDFLHAKPTRGQRIDALITAWRKRRPDLDILNVRGNHDRTAGDPPSAWGIACVTEPVEEPPFAFRHHPEPSGGRYTVAGHVHPAVHLSGAGRQRERLPCFLFGDRIGILPAFGGLTGMWTVTPAPGDRVFVIAGSEVIRVQ